MACYWLQRGARECHYDKLYQVLESYDIKRLVCEAENQRILTLVEKKEIERQGSSCSMRKRLVSLILQRGEQERAKFAGFIEGFSRRSFEQVCQVCLSMTAGFQRQEINGTIVEGVGCLHPYPGKELTQLSQDSLCSAGSTSPMECEQTQDGGYFTASVGGSTDQSFISGGFMSQVQPYYSTNLDQLESDLKRFQETHMPLQNFIANKTQQRQVPAHSSPLASLSGQSASQGAPGTVNYISYNNYVFNTVPKINSGSDKSGTPMLEYPDPGTAPPVESEEPLESADWSRCLKEHHRRIIDHLNVNALLPHLNQKCLLTPGEDEELDSMRMTPRRQARYLLKILPGKGKDGFKLFLECLRDEKDHLGHKDLATCLGLSSQIPIAV